MREEAKTPSESYSITDDHVYTLKEVFDMWQEGMKINDYVEICKKVIVKIEDMIECI